MLPMSELDSRQLEKLAERFRESGLRTTSTFSRLASEGHAGRIASGLSQECNVHLTALTFIVATLLGELSAWLASRPADQTPMARDIDRCGWSYALEGIEQCTRAVQVDRTDQWIALARVITAKAVNLAGGEYYKTAVEIVEALENIEKVADIQVADIRTTVKVLAKIELFLMSTLLAGQYAVARVRALTGPAGESTLKEALDSISQEAGRQARQVVIDNIHKARKATAVVAGPEEGEITLLRDGFWPISVQ